MPIRLDILGLAVSQHPSNEIDSKGADRKLNAIGYAAARAAIGAGAVSEAPWSFDAADGDALLGEGGDDWRRFGRAHLAVNTDADPESKARYSYPWGKLVEGRLTLFVRALRAIRGRAAQHGDTGIFNAAGRLMDALGDDNGDGDRALAEAFERAALAEAEREPDAQMALEADRGLAWFQRYRRGGTPLDLARALAIRARSPLPGDVVAALVDRFAATANKHLDDGWLPGQRGYPSAARIHWALIGGDAGYRWAVRTAQTVRHILRDKKAGGVISKAALIQDRSAGGVTFVASDESIDRMGDIIVAAGWQLENFRRNPQLLFGHLRDALPVGRVDRVWVDGKRLLARASFLPDGVDAFADKVAKLVREGFLNAVSVGFFPLKSEPRTEDGRFLGIRYLEQELVELSVVPVPANANAVALARSIGCTDADLQRCFADPAESPGVPAAFGLADHRLRLMRLRRCG